MRANGGVFLLERVRDDDFLWTVDIDSNRYECQNDYKDSDFLTGGGFTSMMKRNRTKFIEVY